MKKLLIVSLLVFIFAAANAATSITINVDLKQEHFVVILPANPTTGYQWELKNYDQSLLKLVGSKYLPPKSQLIGAGGKTEFSFKLIKGKSYPAKTTMLFNYLRPWEPETGNLKTVNINFKN